MEYKEVIKSMRESFSMTKQRCLNPNNSDFKHYGGRGIKVCVRWLNFENFLADMGVRPEGKTLERIDNDKDYEPSNCRWASRAEQSLNTRKTTFLTVGNETKTLSEWAKVTGISKATLKARMFVLGYTPEQIISKSVKCGGMLPDKVYKVRKKPDMSNARKGADCTQAKLTVAQVLEIRKLYATGDWTLKNLGDKFGVVFQTISLIVNRKTYKEI